MKKILIMMCGVPGSGKSTVATTLHYFLGEVPCISMDDIREELFGSRKCQKHGDVVYQYSIDDTVQAFSRYDIVIYDATNRTQRSRRTLVEDIQKYIDCIVYCIYMNTPLEIALERNVERDESMRVPPEVIHRMYNSLQPPTEEEKYFEEIFIIDPKVLDTCGDMWYNLFVNLVKGELKQ